MDKNLLYIMVGFIVGVFIGFVIAVGSSPNVSEYQERIEELNQKISALNATIQSLKSEIAKKDSTISELKNKISSLTETLNQKEDEIAQLTQEKTRLEQRISELNDEIEKLKGSQAPQPPQEGKLGSSIDKPAPIGTTITCVDTILGDQYILNITVVKAIRGNDAWKMIKEANMFNDPPKDGYEYVLVKVRIKYISGPSGQGYYINPVRFNAVSENGVMYENPFVVVPEPKLGGTIFQGATKEGWIAFEVSIDDKKPRMVFGFNEFLGTGGIWFKLYQE